MVNKIRIIVISVLIIGCTENKRNNSEIKNQPKLEPVAETKLKDEIGFDEYINSLDKIALPFKYSSKHHPIPNPQSSYNKAGFKKYKQYWAELPLGLLKTDDNFIVTVDLVVGDHGYVPYLMSYDKNGDKVDSLNAFDKAGLDMGFKAHEYITVDENLNVTVVDSIWRKDLNENRSNVIEGTEKLETGNSFYNWNSNGKFEKVKK